MVASARKRPNRSPGNRVLQPKSRERMPISVSKSLPNLPNLKQLKSTNIIEEEPYLEEKSVQEYIKISRRDIDEVRSLVLSGNCPLSVEKIANALVALMTRKRTPSWKAVQR